MPDNNAYAKLAEGFELLAAGYRLLADENAMPTTALEPKEPDDPIAIEQIHSVMTAKRSKGKIAKVRELFLKYGAGRLSEIKTEDYAQLLRELEAL